MIVYYLKLNQLQTISRIKANKWISYSYFNSFCLTSFHLWAAKRFLKSRSLNLDLNHMIVCRLIPRQAAYLCSRWMLQLRRLSRRERHTNWILTFSFPLRCTGERRRWNMAGLKRRRHVLAGWKLQVNQVFIVFQRFWRKLIANNSAAIQKDRNLAQIVW